MCRANLPCRYSSFSERLNGVDEEAIKSENRKPRPSRQFLVLVKPLQIVNRLQKSLVDAAAHGGQYFLPRSASCLKTKTWSQLTITTYREVGGELGTMVN